MLKEAYLCLAPIAGYSNAPFRLLCFAEGADFAYTEMVSADGLVRDGVKTKTLMKRLPGEGPVGIQLFGSDPEIIAGAAEKASGENPAFIDLNFGCPVKKVVKRNGGVALMRDLELMGKIASRVVSSVDIPVTAKIRSGWNRSTENFIEAGLVLQDAGVAAVAIHPRYRDQGFKGRAHWEHIARLREALSIEVIANGDVKSVEDFLAIRESTGCRIVMIGRGALGRPWIFRMIKDRLSGKGSSGPDARRMADYLRKHFELEVGWKGEERAVVEMRKHFRWYLRGLPNVKEFRMRLSVAGSAEEIGSIIDEFEKELEERWRKLA